MYGSVSEVPYFVGRDPLSVLLEPLYASAGSLSIYRDNRIWGGAVIFERADIDEAAFLDELPPFGFDVADGYLTPNEDYDIAVEIIDRVEKGESKRSTARAAGVDRRTISRILERKELYCEHEPEPELYS